MWDAGGAESAKPGSNSIYTGVHGVIICYDAADAESFKSVRRWRSNVERFAPAGVCTVLVGNKEDAEPPTPEAYSLADANAAAAQHGGKSPRRKRVQPAQGEKLASEYKVRASRIAEAHCCCSGPRAVRVTLRVRNLTFFTSQVPFVSTSAFEGGGVDEAFALLTEAMHEARETREANSQRRLKRKPWGAELLGELNGGGAASPDEGRRAARSRRQHHPSHFSRDHDPRLVGDAAYASPLLAQ